MKDVIKFAMSSLLMLVTLIMINMISIPMLMSDYSMINLILTIAFTLLALAAAAFDGVNRGAKDCKYTALMEKQQRERGYVLSDAEKDILYRPMKGVYAGLILSAPAVLMSLVCIVFNADSANWVINFIVRMTLGHFLGLFSYINGLMPWIGLLLALVYPAVLAGGYLCGPKMWAKQQEQMEKAKREKRRKVSRRRKKKNV